MPEAPDLRKDVLLVTYDQIEPRLIDGSENKSIEDMVVPLIPVSKSSQMGQPPPLLGGSIAKPRL